jgi:hypothetical protein
LDCGPDGETLPPSRGSHRLDSAAAQELRTESSQSPNHRISHIDGPIAYRKNLSGLLNLGRHTFGFELPNDILG